MGYHRVLVVDDESTIRHVLQTILVKHGCEVRQAGSAEDALELLEGWEPEVALLDIVLPGKNGIQLLGEIKEIHPRTEVLIMTSNASSETALQAIRGGAYDYLKKPFDLKEVWTTVQRSIEKRNLDLKHRNLVEAREQKSRELSCAVSLAPKNQGVEEFSGFAEILDYFLDVVTRELDAKRATLMMLEKETGELRIVASRGFPEDEVDKVRVRLGQGIAGAVAQTGEPFLVTDTRTDSRIEAGKNPHLSDSFISAPIELSVAIKSEHRVLGVINVTNRRSGEAFSREDLTFLATLTGQLAAAIDGAKRAEKLQRAYEALKAAQDRLVFDERIKAVGQMAAGVAHDFNNVLGVILARTQSVLMKLDGEPLEMERIHADLEAVLKTALLGAEAIKRIQDYTRIRRDVPSSPVNLNAVVRDAVEIARPKWKEECGAQGRTIEVQLDLGEVSTVSGNVYELTQVVGNLIFNAVEAMPDGGRLSFRTSEQGEKVVLEVQDTGIGMDDETRRRLFEPFFTTKATGQGLGTSITFGIVSRHRGEITVESEPGRGSIFRIALPRLEIDAAVREPVREASREAFVPARVLLVDDDEMVRETYEDVLIAGGHEVVPAASGPEALAICGEHDLDLVITDLSMSGLSGLDVAKAVKKLDPDLPVILFTGAVQQQRESFREAGIDHVLAKPCMIEDLLDAVRKTARTTIRA